MVPDFLKSLALLVRQLVADGHAVHVTAKTADELELLAGLPWESMTIGTVAGTTQQVRLNEHGQAVPAVAPADLALGWLLGSKAEGPAMRDAEQEAAIMRAAKCAELALVAAGVCLNAEECPRLDEADFVSAHQGSREGARAAWGFVVGQWTGLFDGSWAAHVGMDGGPTQTMLDTYRRELEAMR